MAWHKLESFKSNMKHYYNWLLGLVLLVSIGLAICLGTTTIPLTALFAGQSQTWHLVLIYRLPRLIVALFGGAILGSSGLLLQIVLRNRLVDPSILGMMNGTQFLTVGILVIMPTLLTQNVLIGSLSGLIIMLGWHLLIPKNRPRLQLVLIGIATAMTFQALTNLASEGFGVPLPTLGTVTWLQVIQLLMMTLIGGIFLMLAWSQLKYFALPSQQVKLLGINENQLLWFILITIGLWTGALTSLLGVVFFLGAILPQIARLMAPHAQSQGLLVPTMLWGSLLLINADTLARTILAPKELPTSAVLLAISGPLFALMLLKGGRHAKA